MNTREKLLAIADWIGWQEEVMSDGLRSVTDAEKLYDVAMRGELPEMADEWEEQQRIDVLGYDPMEPVPF